MENQRKLALLSVIFCSGICFWFYESSKTEYDFKRSFHLIDPLTGVMRRPINGIMNMTKVSNLTKEYIETTNAQQRLYDMEYNTNLARTIQIDYHEYSDRNEMELSGLPVANITSCGFELNWILNQLDTYANYTLLNGQLGFELTKLMDSFGRPESNTYSGVVNWLGSYKSCNGLKINDDRITTRYCVGRFRPKWWPKKEAAQVPTVISIGICLPETCDTLSYALYNSSIEKLAKFELPEFHKNGLNMISLYCLPDERSPIRKIPISGRIHLFVTGIWLITIVIASAVYEILLRRKRASIKLSVSDGQVKKCPQDDNLRMISSSEKILEAISLRNSLKLFTQISFKVNEKGRKQVDLNGVCFIKCLMIIIVIFVHSSMIILMYSRSLANRAEILTSSASTISLSILNNVNSFFLIFGLLATYSMLNKPENAEKLLRPINLLSRNYRIMLRTFPAYIIAYWYFRSIYPYLNQGPWWDYGTYWLSLQGICKRESYLKTLPYFGSVNLLNSTCSPPSWFIVSYSHLALLIPFIAYLICNLPTYLLKCSFVAFMLIASALSSAIKCYNQTTVPEEAFSFYAGYLIEMFERYETMGYLTTLPRLGCTAVGCFAGYLLREYECGKVRKWPKWLISESTTAIVFVLHFLLLFYPMIRHEIFRSTGKIESSREFIGFNIAYLILWPIINALLIVSLSTAFNESPIWRFFSHPFWQLSNKLILVMLLFHWGIIMSSVTGNEQAPGYGFQEDVLITAIYALILSMIVAFVVTIIVCTPFACLIDTLVKLVAAKVANEKIQSNERDVISLSNRKDETQ